MSKTLPNPVNDTGSVYKGFSTSGCGRGRTRGGRDDRSSGGGSGRHHQNKYRNTKVFKGSTNGMNDNNFQCY